MRHTDASGLQVILGVRVGTKFVRAGRLVGGCTSPVGLTAGTGNLGLGTSALRQESVDLSGRRSSLRSRSLCLDCRGVCAGFGGLGRSFRTECLGLSGL